METDLTRLTIAAAAEEIGARRLSPVELTEAYLARIERLNPRINAYLTITWERAREDARRAEDEIASGSDRGLLHGIPIGLKDLYDTAGIRTTYGSLVHRDHVPRTDSTVARRLRQAGCVLLGKHNTHEYAWGVTTNNPHHGPTRNPWDTARIPGGSSGGSAAAIAAGLCCAAMGTDTGGSIRVPASLCGVVGFKPTFGRVSKAGVFPMSYLLDHAGPITHSVEDAAILLAAVSGYDAGDFSTVPVPVPDYRAALGEGIGKLRIGLPVNRSFAVLDEEVKSAMDAAIRIFSELRASIVEVELPETPWEAMSVAVAEGKRIHAQTLATRKGDLGADLQQTLSSPALDELQFAEALRAMETYGEVLRMALERVDVLLTATTPIVAAGIGEEMVTLGGIEMPMLLALVAHTAPFNISRLPALSVPCGFTTGGLPIGLQIVGRPFDETTVLRAGYAYEQATQWHRQRPQLD